MLSGLLTGLTAISSALFAINTTAEIGGKIHRGIKQGKQNRAERRWRMSPQKAARLLRAELHRAGQPVTKVKPALDSVGVWRLLVEGTAAFPESYEGYPVVSKDARMAAQVGAQLVEVGRGGRGGGGRGGRGHGFRGGRGWGGRWGGRRWGGGWGGGVYPWWGGWGPLYIRRRRNELDEIEAELDEEAQLQRIKRKRAALGD